MHDAQEHPDYYRDELKYTETDLREMFTEAELKQIDGEERRMELVKIENELVAATIDPAVVFAPSGMENIITTIEIKARSFVPDVETAKGRAAIGSLCQKVASSKVFLDNAGKKYVEDLKEKIKPVDAERKRMRDRLDALKEEINSPRAEWEAQEVIRLEAEEVERQAKVEAEMARVLSILASIAAIKAISGNSTMLTSEGIAAQIAALEVLPVGDDEYQEFRGTAQNAKTAALQDLGEMLTERLHDEAETARVAALLAAKVAEEEAARIERDRLAAVEAERLKAEQAALAEAREEFERQQVAAAKLRVELEAKDKAVRDEADRVARADAKRVADEQAAAVAKIDAQVKALRAEEDRVAKAARDLADAEAKALRDAEDKRIAEEQAKLAAELAVLEAEIKRKQDDVRANSFADVAVLSGSGPLPYPIDEEMVTITRSEYTTLIEKSQKWAALEEAGVDNWEGYEEAMAIFEDGEGKS